MVDILASGRRSCWERSHFLVSLSRLPRIAFSKACASFSRSWEAASTVKVTASSLSAGSLFTGSESSRIVLSMRTAVLPLPAAAETTTPLSVVVMALDWSSFQDIFSGIGVSSFHFFFYKLGLG